MKHELKAIAKEIDSKFDYSNSISFNKEYLVETFGSEFFEKFTCYFSNEWHGILGDAIMDIDLPDLISRGVKHALVESGMEYIDNSDYSAE